MRKGFTLIELLVVIAIIGILATLVITQVASAQVRARNSQAMSDISQAGKSVETFRSAYSIETWKGNATDARDAINVAPYTNATPPVSVATGANISGTAAATATWAARFTGVTSASTFSILLAKTPGASYRYGYMTDASAGSTGAYCIGTNVVNTSGVTGAVGFMIKNGSSLNAAAAEPSWSTWAPSYTTATPCT